MKYFMGESALIQLTKNSELIKNHLKNSKALLYQNSHKP